MCFEFTSDFWVHNVWSDTKIEAWENKNVRLCSNCGHSKDEDDHGSILEMKYPSNNCDEIKLDLKKNKKTPCLINAANKDELNNEDHLDISENEFETRQYIV